MKKQAYISKINYRGKLIVQEKKNTTRRHIRIADWKREKKRAQDNPHAPTRGYRVRLGA